MNIVEQWVYWVLYLEGSHILEDHPDFVENGLPGLTIFFIVCLILRYVIAFLVGCGASRMGHYRQAEEIPNHDNRNVKISAVLTVLSLISEIILLSILGRFFGWIFIPDVVVGIWCVHLVCTIGAGFIKGEGDDYPSLFAASIIQDSVADIIDERAQMKYYRSRQKTLIS